MRLKEGYRQICFDEGYDKQQGAAMRLDEELASEISIKKGLIKT